MARAECFRACRRALCSNPCSQEWCALCLICVCLHIPTSCEARQDCSNRRCGSVDVPPPFYIQKDCGQQDGFYINCTNDVPYISNSSVSLQVLNFFQDSLIVNVTAFVLPCDPSNTTYGNITLPRYPHPYAISPDNKFVIFGCNYGVYSVDYNGFPGPLDMVTENNPQYIVGGCLSDCSAPSDPDPPCYNSSCCYSPLQNGPHSIYYSISTNVEGRNTCAGFSLPFYPDKTFTDLNSRKFALKLLWAVPYNKSKNENDIQSNPTYACANNSKLTYVNEVPGYLCACREGFVGDGYLTGLGCSDRDECTDGSDLCVKDRAECKNTEGNYTCSCKSGRGDGYQYGSGCDTTATARLLGGILGGFAGLALVIVTSLWWFRKNSEQRRYALFVQNGGLQMQEFISSVGGRETAKLYSEKELKAATNNFAEHLKIGAGGFGTVFKGTLEDGRIVAIKKSNHRSGNDTKQFLNEVAILSQINHRHVVRLLGCCVDREEPLLVYEYVSNGTLADHLYGNEYKPSMDWDRRLEIAIQTAEALAYLHSAASPPILHRDVKSLNILLDENLNAKVADFGASLLIPDGHNHISAAVQGTIGYLDPEYLLSLELTDKSDVYSYGVVLAELITGLKPVDNKRQATMSSLASMFINRYQQGRVEDIMYSRLESWDEQVRERVRVGVKQAAGVAASCLALRGAERPSMKEVVQELHWVRSSKQLGLKKGWGVEKEEEEEAMIKASTSFAWDGEGEVEEGEFVSISVGSSSTRRRLGVDDDSLNPAVSTSISLGSLAGKTLQMGR